MKVGDKVKIKNVKGVIDNTVYTVVEILGNSIKVKHPSIGGHFIFLAASVAEVL